MIKSKRELNTFNQVNLSSPLRFKLLTSLILTLALSLSTYFIPTLSPFTSSTSQDFSFLHYSKQCPILSFIPQQEFSTRRATLAKLLSKVGTWGAYITEPSPNTLYYTNLSQSSWYLSERPWLISITPTKSSSHLSILTPSFELSRSQRLPFALSPAEFDDVSWVTWDEAENPYQVLLSHLSSLRESEGFSEGGPWKVHLEENLREFVADGLREASNEVGGISQVGLADLKVREQRMRKTEHELELQRCGAKITVTALRTVRKLLYYGMTEKEGETLIRNALTTAGLTDLDYIVLFGENAALPHASASSTKTLQPGEFALFDVGGNLGGYISDFTRTMLPSLVPSYSRFWSSCHHSKPAEDESLMTSEGEWPSARAKKIWETVQRAQIAGLEALVPKKNGEENEQVWAMDVDKAAREVIVKEGWGKYFSHRVGHGIGLQVHEHPYLNSGNRQPLQPGETFSDEPGIYIEQSVDTEGNGIGVRIEDMVLKTEEGWELISGLGLAQSPWSP